MNLVYENKNNLNMVPRNKNESVLKAWLMANSLPTILKYNELEKSGFKKSLTFEGRNIYYINNSKSKNSQLIMNYSSNG